MSSLERLSVKYRAQFDVSADVRLEEESFFDSRVFLVQSPGMEACPLVQIWENSRVKIPGT